MKTKQSGLAGQYLRMSTDQQDLSIDIQREAIQRHAEANGLQIIQTYEDRGRSGLKLSNRPAMKQLLADVVTPECPFDTLLVYDVSRWGRFQDTDASAYHEYHCRLHGVDVVYVAEAFGTEQGPVAALIKSLKRAMAAEYSRELAVKARAGQERVIALGFSAGGQPALGLVRRVVASDGSPRLVLRRGERKAIQSDRIQLTPGAPEEVALLRRIFHLYANTTANVNDLVRLLAAEGVLTPAGRPFTRQVLDLLLRYEPFIGNYVWGRLTNTPEGIRPAPASKVLRRNGLIDPVIDRGTWDKVQAKLAAATRVMRPKEQMLESLAAALKKDPAISAADLPRFACAPSHTYAKAFGSMAAAYALAGRNQQAAGEATKRRIQNTQTLTREFRRSLTDLLHREGATVSQDLLSHVMTVNSRWKVKVQLAWRRSDTKEPAWFIPRHRDRIASDFRLVVRLNDDGTPRDYLLIPYADREAVPTLMREVHMDRLRAYHLTRLGGLAARLERRGSPRGAGDRIHPFAASGADDPAVRQRHLRAWLEHLAWARQQQGPAVLRRLRELADEGNVYAVRLRNKRKSGSV